MATGRKSKGAYPRELVFEIDYTSMDDGIRYEGRFTARRPNVFQWMEMEGLKSKMLGGKYYDPDNPGCGVPEHMEMMAETAAFLRIAIIDAPEWWGEEEIFDPGLLAAVFAEARKVDPFRYDPGEESGDNEERVGGRGEPSHSQHHEPQHTDSLASMVDTEV